jgi:hypothetical protein
MVLRRRFLPFGEAVDLDASVRTMALDLIDSLEAGELEILEGPANARPFAASEFREFLERVASWDAAAWFAHRERYLATYGPISFLPPDGLNALILQATLGHPGGVAFGQAPAFEHYLRSPKEFEEHARAVAKLMGGRISQCRGILLGGADCLHRPLGELEAILEIIGRVFPLGDRAGHEQPSDAWDGCASNVGKIHAFLDDFQGPLPGREGWRVLQDLGLGRVTLGLESGSRDIRSAFGRSWSDDDLQQLLADLKAVKIEVGLVVLLGSGGRAKAEEHRDSTVQLLESLELDRSDLVTLVDSRSLARSPSADALSDEEIAREIELLKRCRRESRDSKGPKVVAYNPDKQFS